MPGAPPPPPPPPPPPSESSESRGECVSQLRLKDRAEEQEARAGQPTLVPNGSLVLFKVMPPPDGFEPAGPEDITGSQALEALIEGPPEHLDLTLQCGRLLECGPMQMCPLPPPPESPVAPMLVVLSGQKDLSFWWDQETQLWVTGDQLLFLAPAILIPQEGQGRIHWACALQVEPESLPGLVEKLLAQGFRIRWRASAEAKWAAEGVQAAGAALASVMRAAASFTADGVRAAGEAARGSEVFESFPMEVAPEALEAAAATREASQAIAQAAGHLVSGISEAFGWAAAAIHDQMPAASERWHEDLRVLGQSSLTAGAEIWEAAKDSRSQLWTELTETSTDVIGTKFGSDAGTMARDSLQTVGHLMAVQSLTKPSVGLLLTRPEPQPRQEADCPTAY